MIEMVYLYQDHLGRIYTDHYFDGDITTYDACSGNDVLIGEFNDQATLYRLLDQIEYHEDRARLWHGIKQAEQL